VQSYDSVAFAAFLSLLLFYRAGFYYKKIINKKIRENISIKFLYSILIFALTFGISALIGAANLDLGKINFYLLCLYIILVFVPLMKIINFHLRKIKNSAANIAAQSDINEKDDRNILTPDIYYIITDGYPGSNALKEVLNFDNHDFYDFLQSKNFCVSKEALSNYPITNLSICSSLNMDYIHNFFDHSKFSSDQEAIHALYQSHLNNRVIKEFKKQGYKYIHLVNHWEQMYFNSDDNADIEIKSSESTDFLKVLLQKTLIGIFQKNIFTTASRKNMQFLFEKLKSLVEIKGPKFVFAHLICPHEPYIFDQNGNSPKIINEDPSSQENIPLFLGQIKYLNKVLKDVIENILEKSPNSIIIMHADHGSEFLLHSKSIKSKDCTPIWPVDPSPEMLLEKFNIFSAIYLPQKNIEVYRFFKTPVNIFRFILNQYFKTDYKIIEEKQYYSNYIDHFNSTDVTDKIKRD